jgi:hypothetical protein
MEEFIFDDDVEDVGAEIEAHCPKCRSDTTHVIVSKYEDEVRKVQCNTCSDVHGYKKPRGESEEEEAAAPASKKKVKAKPTYDQVMAKQKKPPRAYAINEFFKEPEVLTHPKFGLGFVSDNIGEDKIEVSFQTEKRVLIHNRKNMNLPILREINPPKETGGHGHGHGKKKGAKAAAPPPPPPPAAKPAPAPKGTKPSAAARPAAKKPVKAAAPPKAAAAVAKKAAVAAKKKPAKPAPARKPTPKAKAPAKAAKKHKK